MTSKLLDSLSAIGEHIDLDAFLPALIDFIDRLSVALKDGKVSVGEGIKLASSLLRVVEAARKGA